VQRVPIPVVVALLLNRGRVFMIERRPPKPLAGEWEFPGGKIEVDEPPIVALRRELREELGLRIGRLALFGAYTHVYAFSEGRVHYVLIAYRALVRDGAWSRRGAWVDLGRVTERRVVAGSRQILRDLSPPNTRGRSLR